MARIDEQKMIAEFVGNPIKEESFCKIASPNGSGYGDYSDCEEYIIYNDMYLDDDELKNIFKITPILEERWKYAGVDLRLYVYLKNGVFVGGYIFKYKDTTCSSHYRPTGCELAPTQQETRVARRILEYIIER